MVEADNIGKNMRDLYKDNTIGNDLIKLNGSELKQRFKGYVR